MPELAAYRDNILFRQTGERYAASWHHHNPWYYYLVEVIPWAWMPLSLALPWAIPAWWRRIRRGDARATLLLSGVVLILVFFSLSPGKRGVYHLAGAAAAGPRAGAAGSRLAAKARAERGIGGRARTACIGVPRRRCCSASSGCRRLRAWPSDTTSRPGTGGSCLAWWRRPARGAALATWHGGPRRSGCRCSGFPGRPSATSSSTARGRRANYAGDRRTTGPDAWLAMPNFDEEFLLQSRQPSCISAARRPQRHSLRRPSIGCSRLPDERWMLIEQNRRRSRLCGLDQAIDLGYQNGDYWWLIPGTAFAECAGRGSAAVRRADDRRRPARGTRRSARQFAAPMPMHRSVSSPDCCRPFMVLGLRRYRE